MKNNIYKGYIGSRNIRDNFIPQRIQNLVIRTFCEKRGKIFSLSATEYAMENCFMMMKALLGEVSQYEGIVIYSLFMLPPQKQERMKVYQTCLSAGVDLHFAFEELSVLCEDDIQLIEDIILTKDLSQMVKYPEGSNDPGL